MKRDKFEHFEKVAGILKKTKERITTCMKDLEVKDSELIKFNGHGQWSLNKTAKGKAQNAYQDMKDTHEGPRHLLENRNAWDARVDAKAEKAHAKRTQVAANKKIQARKEINKPGKSIKDVANKWGATLKVDKKPKDKKPNEE